jgi:hypothetical protein
LVNILVLRLCNYDKSPDHVESAGKFTLRKLASNLKGKSVFENNRQTNYCYIFWRAIVRFKAPQALGALNTTRKH